MYEVATLHDQTNGYLVRSGDINSFSEALLTLINDPKGSCKMGMNGRILVSEHNIQNTWVLHENLYHEAIKRTNLQRTEKISRGFPQWDFWKTLMGLE